VPVAAMGSEHVQAGRADFNYTAWLLVRLNTSQVGMRGHGHVGLLANVQAQGAMHHILEISTRPSR